jgi:hypothetical protein
MSESELNGDRAVIENYRTHHHAIAQLIALGFTDQMIRRRTGVSYRSLVIYRNDPSFKELIEHYSRRRDELFETNIDPYRDLSYENMMSAEYTVQEHFERARDTGEMVPLAIANKISQDRADRLGYSKHSVVQHNHDFASQLDKAISRSKTVLIEGYVEEPSLHETTPAPQETVLPIPSPSPAEPSPPPRKLSIASVQRMEIMKRRFS